MLGRHVYRVHPADGQWVVIKDGEIKDGEPTPRGRFAGRDEALAEASRLAEADQPSRVVVDDGDGAILHEALFGTDLSQELGT